MRPKASIKFGLRCDVGARRFQPGTVNATRPRRSASNELRWIADALSEARNLDVFASALLAPARAALPWSSELERLAMAIDRRRQTAHAAARTAIRFGPLRRLGASLGELA